MSNTPADFASVPIIDVSPLLSSSIDHGETAESLGRACRECGFFYVVGHGVDEALLLHLETLSREFFARDQSRKMRMAMSLTKLWLLNLSGNSIDDDSLPALTILPKLTELELTRTKITDKGLEYLAACPSLVTLRLDGTAITDASLSEFGKCPKLRSVSIRETKISDEALAAFRKIHPTIRFYR